MNLSLNQRFKVVFLWVITSLLFSCKPSSTTLVNNAEELQQAIENAQPGDEIVMANGEWNDVEIRFLGEGTENKPITLRGETAGEVIIQGLSDLKLGGKYLVVKDLMFTNGHSPSRSVIQFYLNRDTIANHCRVTNCVIEDFNKPQRNKSDIWVMFKGRHNQLDHCYIAGKSNRGPTVRVDLEGNPSINNYHKINNNHFGPRPPKGGPSAETIQIGNSYTSMAPSYTMVENNLFDRCNGEVEVISSKTNFNEFRNNVFYKSEGSLVTRHGNYCTVDGNYFIGDENSEQIGGVRLIGTGHWVTNNYFYNLRGQQFRSPLAVMNGIKKSPLNRYIQVTDVVVAYNSWINCTSPWQFGVGSNVEQADVLPASEIRSERPKRTIVANNIIHNSKGDTLPVFAHDKLDGINFQNNLINNQGVNFTAIEGLTATDFGVEELAENIWMPSGNTSETEPYSGFEFDKINKDIFGNSRNNSNAIGAIIGSNVPDIMDLKQYGTNWYDATPTKNEAQTHSVSNAKELAEKINTAQAGDIISLKAGNYDVNASLKITKNLTIQSADANNKAMISYSGGEKTPLFEMNPKGELTLDGVQVQGSKTQYAFASLDSNMSSLYNLTISNSDISDFDYILKAYKYSFSEFIKLNNSTFKNCNNGFELSEELDDRGEYNAENIFIDKCHFESVAANVLDYYRGGYDESTVGGNLKITNSTFTQCGAKEKNGILLNTYGIINVDISNNTFTNNRVKQVAQLWGAKNNSHSNNTISNSGKIVVEENLKLNLMY